MDPNVMKNLYRNNPGMWHTYDFPKAHHCNLETLYQRTV